MCRGCREVVKTGWQVVRPSMDALPAIHAELRCTVNHTSYLMTDIVVAVTVFVLPHVKLLEDHAWRFVIKVSWSSAQEGVLTVVYDWTLSSMRSLKHLSAVIQFTALWAAVFVKLSCVQYLVVLKLIIFFFIYCDHTHSKAAWGT